MRYQIKQKLLSLSATFYIMDEAGKDVFLVEGALGLSHQLSFYDMSNNELAFIKQKLLSWRPTYELYRYGELSAVVYKEFSFLKHEFRVELPESEELIAEGDLLDLEFAFSRDGQEVARVSRRFFSLADTYGVDIADGEDDVLILASTIVMDMVRGDTD